MIILFAFFYIGIVFNPTELADTCARMADSFRGFGRAALPPSTSANLEAADIIGRHLSLPGLPPARWLITGIHLDHIGLGNRFVFDRHFPTWFLNGPGCAVLFWRYVSPDRGWRGDGYRAAA